MRMVVGMAIDTSGGWHGDGAREPIVHIVVLHLVGQDLQVHERIAHCLDFNLQVGDGRAESNRTMKESSMP